MGVHRFQTRIFVITLFLILFLSTSLHAAKLSDAAFDEAYQYTPSGLSILNADEIIIESDLEFTENGFVGEGTSSNPYVLEDIAFPDSHGGVLLYDTTKYFVIRNCTFPGYWSGNIVDQWEGPRVVMNNVTNGIVEDCIFGSGEMFLYQGDNCIIRNNIVFAQSEVMSFGMGFEEGILPLGLFITETNDTTVANNIVFHCDRGLTLIGTNLTVMNNRIHSNLQAGLFLDTYNSTVTGNSIYAHGAQIYNIGTWENTGIALSDSENTTLHSNAIGWNTINAKVDGTPLENQWDDGISSGNQWSDYDESGTYEIAALNEDRYPELLIDSQSPMLTSSGNRVLEWPVPELSINWILQEQFPTVYELYFDGDLISGGGIISDDLEFNVGAFDIGEYNLTLKVYDGAGNHASDSIIITVTPMNHNLEWGVSVDDTLEYDFYTAKDTTSTVTSITEGLLITVTDLPEIPGKLFYVPMAEYRSNWRQNNETMPSLEYFFEGAGAIWAILSPAIPIGNWSLLTSFVTQVTSEAINITVVQDTLRWGVEYRIVESGVTLESTTMWLKSDGTLDSVRLSIESPGGVIEVSILKPGILGPDILLFLLVGLGGFGVAVVVLVIIRRR